MDGWIDEDKNYKSSIAGLQSLTGDRKKKEKIDNPFNAVAIYQCEYSRIKIS